MWKLLGFSDEKDPEAAAAPQQLTMVRSRAVRGEEAEAEGAPSPIMSKKDEAKSGGSGGLGRFTSCEFKSHGIKVDYPKSWSVVEEQRKIIVYHPSDRSISINLIIGVVAPGTDLDELTAQALEMPQKLMMKGVLDPKSLPLVVKDVTMLGRPACSLAYKLNMGGQRQVEQTWTENRGRSFIVTRAGPENVYDTHRPVFERIIQSLAFLSKEAEEYEPPAEERKRAARLRRNPSAQPASHEGMYLSKPGVLIYSTFEDYSKHFRVRYPGIFEATPTEDAEDGVPSLTLKLSLHSKGARHQEENKTMSEKQEKEARELQKLRDSLEAVKITVTVSASKSEDEHIDEARRLAIGAEVSTSDAQLSGIAARKLTYDVTLDAQTRKLVEVIAVKDEKLYIVSLSHPHDETNESTAEADAHAYFFGHIIRQFEFIDESSPSKANLSLYQNHTTHPKIAIEYPLSTYQIQPNMGGPFVISLVHFADEEGEDVKGKGKAKATGSSSKPNDPKSPTSMIGLLVAPLPQTGDKNVWNLEKFGKMIKDQLLQKGSNCRIMREEDVTIANGRMKGRDIVYIADAQPPGAAQQGMKKNALAMPQMRCLQRVYLFGNTSYVLLFQTLDANFDEEWALASTVLNSFQFFSS
jgi:hypothetical protein